MQLKSVVLPAPFGPMRPTISASFTSKETPSSAVMPPNRTRTSRQLSIAFAPPSTATAGGSLSKKDGVAQSSPEEAADPRAVRLLDVLVVLQQKERRLLRADPEREPDRLQR